MRISDLKKYLIENLHKMKIIIQTPTPNLDNTLQFYTSLGFKYISHNNRHFVGSKGLIIEINKEKTARPAIKLIANDWDADVYAFIEKDVILPNNENIITQEPSGVRLVLEDNFPETILTSFDETEAMTGNYMGVSVETLSLKKSADFWKNFGMDIVAGGINDGWLSMSNSEGAAIAYMAAGSCPHLFFNPSLTFFNGEKNIEIISKIRETGISIAEEITVFNKKGVVDNIVLVDPGGLGFLIFSD